MKVGGETGGFMGRIRDGWQQAGETMDQPSQADKEAADRQARTDELRAILEQQKPVEINAERVARNVESFRRLSKNLTDAEIRQASDFNNPEVRAAYDQWQMERPVPQSEEATQVTESNTDTVVHAENRFGDNQDQEPAA